MSAEQQIREALAYVEEAYDRKRNPNLSILLAAVGRLLDPIPDEAIEAMAGDWLTVHIRRDLAEKMLSGYRAWLISGDSDE